MEFDNNGNMVLGFRDRWGDQMGYNVNIPNGSTTLVGVAVVGVGGGGAMGSGSLP